MTDTPTLDHPVCGCGTCRDAVDTVLKLFQQNVEHDCLHWYMALAACHAVVAAHLRSMEKAAGYRDLLERETEVLQMLSGEEALWHMADQMLAILGKRDAGAAN